MPSIASVLNIAKEALLTHQASINVAGHNIANVDNPGYTRQVLDLTTPVATPDRAGFFGNGVRSESVVRQYDQFMVKRLMDQNSTINNLEAQQQTMQVVETTFNETTGLAVNDLMSQFWAAWQSLSNNPELSSTRQTVVQKAEILNDKFQSMTADINQVKLNIDENLKSTISDVNSLTKQLANINVKISASETTRQQQNDLRDTRDDLLKKLSGYVDVNYFESANGAYTIMLGDGHSLVNNNESWSLDWSDNKLHWVQTSATGAKTMAVIPSGEALGAKLGGLVGMNNQLVEGNPDNYLGRLNSLANSLIREVNQQYSQGVGVVPFSDRLVSSEEAHDAALLQTTVDADTAAETIIAGSMQINGRDIGRIDGSSVVYGQAMGKTYNAATAINAAGAGVIARMTTQVAGSAVTPMVNPTDDGKSISFTVNGIAVNYTVNAAGAPDDTDPAVLAGHLKDAVNQAISDYNNNVGLTAPQTNQPKMTIEAVVGNGLNGGAVNALVLRNTNKGDESQIVIAGLDQTDAVEAKVGLTDGTYTADATHNTGELSVFTGSGPISIDGGADDTIMAQLGWAGTVHYSDNAVTVPGVNSSASFTVNGQAVSVNLLAADTAAQNAQLIVDEINLVSAKSGVTAKVGNGTNGGVLNSIVFSSETSDIRVDNISGAGSGNLGFTKFTKLGVANADETANDGKLSYTFADNGVAASLMGLDYADTLSTDGKSFKMWLYNKDGSLALAQPVTIPLERAYNLQDVADVINKSIVNAINDSSVTSSWVKATVSGNKLILTPDASHKFAFGGDDSNFLAAIGLNTIFSGHSAGTIGINSTVSDNLNNLAAGSVNEYGEIFEGDNSNALLVSNIQKNEDVTFSGGTTDTLDGFYNSLIAEIGLKSKSINTDLTYNKQVNTQLEAIRDSTSGVSLDEEMANLMKFQHAYTAAAKLITVADEMLQTLLSTVGR